MQSASRRKALLAVCGGIIGAAVFLLLYGFAPLDIFSYEWLLGGYLEQDLAQHYAGWRLFAASDWMWPVGVGQNLLYPDGASVLFSDSIPLFAVIFKALVPLLGSGLQYFGIFVLCSFVLQGAAAALLVSRFTGSFFASALCSALFSCSPVLIERAFRHCSLTAQWLILFALYLYFEAKERGKMPLSYALLAALAVWIHPYFLPLIFAVLMAFCLENAISTRRIVPSALTLAASFAAALLAAVPLGVFYDGFPQSEGGYGWFSLNLNAFFNPLSKGVERWSALLPALPQTNGNLDGFNYLGVGVLIAFSASALCFIFKKGFKARAKTFLEKYWGLLAVTAVLLVFAASNVGTLGGYLLWTVPLPARALRLFSVFRASGRMAWLCYYLIFLCAAVFACRLGKGRGCAAPAVLAAFLLLVQLFDISPALKQKRADFSDLSAPLMSENILSGGFWDESGGDYDEVIALDGRDLSRRIPLAVWAANNGMAVNIGYFGMNVSKDNDEYLSSVRERLQDGTLGKRTLVVATDFNSSAELFDKICGEYGIFLLDGFYIVSSGGEQEITGRSFVASDLDEGNYAGGVNEEARIIAVDNTERNRKLLLRDGEFEIELADKTVTALSCEEDGAYLNLWIKESGLAAAEYPAVLSVTKEND